MGAGIAGLGFEELVLGGLTKVFAGIIIAPIGGIAFGMALAGIIIAVLAKRKPAVAVSYTHLTLPTICSV